MYWWNESHSKTKQVTEYTVQNMMRDIDIQQTYKSSLSSFSINLVIVWTCHGSDAVWHIHLMRDVVFSFWIL